MELTASTWQTWSLSSDSSGLLRIALDNGAERNRTLTLWRCQHYRFCGIGTSFDPTACARLDLSRKFPPGESHLGDVYLRAAPILVGGRIVDTHGEPVSEATVRVYERMPHPQPNSGFQLMHELRGEAAAEGQFQIRGWAEDSVLMVYAFKGGYLPSGPLELTPGATDVQARLYRQASIVASVTEASVSIAHHLIASLISPEDAPPSEHTRDGTTWKPVASRGT